ncbi:hypothetical protein [Cellulomonas massiliensis]|uniref:hypothetical protein n=1 Tax=Cellulomonas massiliensis TaxID=1465811 RepID=UPI0002F5D30E|nr:hypothetical protein [Cellulomonas massiliensis]
MVAQLVRLKLTLLRNGLRRSALQVVGIVLASLYGAGLLVVFVGGMVALSFEAPMVQRTSTVLLGAVIVLGWWLVPLLVFGVDSTLDPLRFVTFAIRRRTLLLGMAVAAVVGVPGVITAVATLSTAVVWWHHPAALVAGLLAAPIGLALAVTGSRAVTTAMARVLARRRAREVMILVVALPFLLLGPALWGFSQLEVSVDAEKIAEVVAWTPLGAPWAVPSDVVAGHWADALGRVLVALVALAGAAWLWDRSLAHALVNPAHEQAGGRARGLGAFGRLPATPLGAVVARCLTYWVRDPRYAVSLVVVPVVVVVLWFVDPGDEGRLALLAGPAVAYLVAWGISADVAFDGTAFWTHLAAPVRGTTDRAGRLLASASFGLPLVVALAVGTSLASARPSVVVPVLGLSLGVLLTSYGVASVLSALVVYPVQLPGENPFQSKQGASMASIGSQLAGTASVVVLVAPTAVLAVLALRDGAPPAVGVLALVVGVLLGAVVLALGVRVGGAALDRTGPDLQRRMTSFT